MKNILETIIKHLVDNQEAIEIIETAKNEKEVLIQVKVAKDDMGKVIGRQGKIAKSIRTVMKSVGAKERKKVKVEFVED
mgnify:FL=1